MGTRFFATATVAVIMGLSVPCAAETTVKVGASSMSPTVNARELISVKNDYYLTQDPKRGDVAVFTLPDGTATLYIKRIVGLPGDRIQMRHGELYINDERVPRRLDDSCAARRDASLDALNPGLAPKGYIESMARGAGEPPVEYCTIKYGDDNFLDNTPAYEVPSEHFFAIGDNRDNSMDSRVLKGFGYVPTAKLVGLADQVVLPPDRTGTKIR